MRLDRDRGGARARALGSGSASRPPSGPGIVRVAAAEMAAAVRVVTVERGVDPRDSRSWPSAAPGPLHAARIAAELGMRRVLVPRAGVLSALGLLLSERRRDMVESVLLAGRADARRLVGAAVEADSGAPAALGERARAAGDLRPALRGAGVRALRCRLASSPSPSGLRRDFDRAHAERYGYADPEAELELVTVRVTAALPGAEPAPARGRAAPCAGPPSSLDGAQLGARARSSRADVEGPRDLRAAGLHAPRAPRVAGPVAAPRRSSWSACDETPRPVTLQVMLGALRAACDEMGAVLVRSAHSANIKERRDASTALFDPAGEMVMQAEHIPVHLGAMPSAVAAQSSASSTRPARPGSSTTHSGAAPHPDITVISPLFSRQAADRLRRQPGASRRRGRARARQHARRLPHARGRGRRDPADKA